MRRNNRGHTPPPVHQSALSISGQTPSETRLTDRHHREKQILEIIQARAARTAFLNVDIFHDPAWEILLALYAANLGCRSITIGSLSLVSRVPASTAIRYLKCLGKEGLLLQEGEDQNDELASVQLSKKGVAAMESYFDYLNSGKFPEVISASKH